MVDGHSVTVHYFVKTLGMDLTEIDEVILTYNFIIIYVTGFWKTDQIVTLDLFHFIGPANGHTHTLHIHSVITRLGGLVCFSRESFGNPVNS